MNLYTRNTAGNNIMPLLINYTPFSKIEEIEDLKIIYDEKRQITKYNARTIGTRCLKSESTRKKTTSTGYVSAVDKKNTIDDSKSVK